MNPIEHVWDALGRRVAGCQLPLTNSPRTGKNSSGRSLPVPTDDVVSRVFIEYSALEQVVTIHPGMTADCSGLVSSHGKPVVTQKVMSGS
ncbi:hypothetical protein TNCV_3560101 [Trichonephila clavipes]|uniref:Uncharacterized protein n=1 Tax=Trichonephila clavipes TaxID=2585209 RepID=A0A8X6WDD5_TRICX|nr:hypothetical protein TNCV_3560101 [Trichonephila clavipes]